MKQRRKAPCLKAAPAQDAHPKPLVNRAKGRPDGRGRDWTPKDPLVMEFVQRVVTLKRGPRTVREYARDIEIFGAFLQDRPSVQKAGAQEGWPYRGPFGGVFAKADVSDVYRFILPLGTLGYNAAATRRKFAVLRRFFQFMKQRNYRAADPTMDVPNVRLPRRFPKAIPGKDVMTLIGTRRPAGQPELRWRRDLAMLELLYASGMRRAELAGVNVSDIDFADRTIRVVWKGEKPRTVLFNHAASDALKAYIQVRPRCQDGALFVSRQGRRLSYQQIGRIFEEYVKLSGLEGKITPHTMRHSVATHLHKSGVDLMTIKDFLGHESIQTTQIYAEMDQQHVKRSYREHHPRDRIYEGSAAARKRLRRP